MNVPALLIVGLFGAAFLAVELKWNPKSTTVGTDLVVSALSTEHMKARTAVRNVLIEPDSGQFEGLRSVAADAGNYVCGLVKAKDRSGNISAASFVYVVAVDFASIDDGGRMTRQPTTQRFCPSAAAEPKIAKDLSISPGALAMVKTAQKLIPEGDPSTLTALASTLAPAAASSGGAGQSMEKQIGELAARTAIPAERGSGGGGGSGGGVSATVAAKVAVSKADQWQADQPPPAWPAFAPGDPLAKPTEKLRPSEALALARDVEERWRRSEVAEDRRMRPSSHDIREASRALLTIDPIDIEYRQAWAAFVRLQQMDWIVTR